MDWYLASDKERERAYTTWKELAIAEAALIVFVLLPAVGGLRWLLGF